MADKSLVKVLTAAASGSSSTLDWPGGVGQMAVAGTFDDCTVKLQMSPDGAVTWIDVGGDASVTEAGVVNFDLRSCEVRLTIASAGGSTAIDGWVTRTTGLFA